MDIKELERLLDLKKAYASVQVSFGKGSKFPAEIKEEIQTKIKEFCLKMSSDTKTEDAEIAGQFTAQEVTVLKVLAESVMNKTVSGGQKAATGPKDLKSIADVAKLAQAGQAPMTATLMTTNSIAADRRKLIDSNDKVTILKLSDTEAVIMKEENKQRFVVPIEDIQVNQPS